MHLLGVLLLISTVSAVRPGFAQSLSPTGHGKWVTGTLQTTLQLSQGWLYSVITFTSDDLLKTYGASTLTAKESIFVNETGSQSAIISQKVNWFILRQDEIPLLTGTESQVYTGTNTVAP